MVIREMIYPLPSPRKMAMTAWLVGVVFDLRLVVPEREVNSFTLYGIFMSGSHKNAQQMTVSHQLFGEDIIL